jgi:hypothetical protein
MALYNDELEEIFLQIDTAGHSFHTVMTVTYDRMTPCPTEFARHNTQIFRAQLSNRSQDCSNLNFHLPQICKSHLYIPQLELTSSSPRAGLS